MPSQNVAKIEGRRTCRRRLAEAEAEHGLAEPDAEHGASSSAPPPRDSDASTVRASGRFSVGFNDRDSLASARRRRGATGQERMAARLGCLFTRPAWYKLVDCQRAAPAAPRNVLAQRPSLAGSRSI